MEEAYQGRGGSNQEVADADYAEELQLEEALKASMAHQELQLEKALEASLADLQLSKYQQSLVSGEPSSSRILCDICMDEKETHDMIKLESCDHSFCSDCIAGHVQAKMEENIHVISCLNLNCNHIIEPAFVRGVIPENVLARWEVAWSESTILDCQKFYCPYKNCSVMLVNDTEEEGIIMESECPECRRLFCAQCRVPWHQGFECEEFQQLKGDERGSDDLLLYALARDKKWTKCPNCKYIVDKTEGCIHMTCRCKFEFCYTCGENWSDSHCSTCQPEGQEDD